MGCQIKLKIEGELDKRFVPHNAKSGPLWKGKAVLESALVAKVMMGYDKDDSIGRKDLKSFTLNLYLDIRSLISLYENDWKKDLDAHRCDDGIYSFCGWEFLSPSVFEEEDNFKAESILSQLLMYSVSGECSVIENSEGFWKKYHEVKEIVSSIKEDVYDRMDHMFVDFYRDKAIDCDEPNDVNEQYE